METGTAEAALARLERAIGELGLARERLGDGLDEALGVVADAITGLELRLNEHRKFQALPGRASAD